MRPDVLLRPRSIAILGASERPSIGRALMESAATLGYEGRLYPINPKYTEILGQRCYPSIQELPPTRASSRASAPSPSEAPARPSSTTVDSPSTATRVVDVRPS
jgi:hypothetical protein